MKKIFLVTEAVGSYEDRYENVVKAFTDIKKAELYVAELTDKEDDKRRIAERCKDCAGDKTCPFYVEPTYKDDMCESWDAFREDKSYYITEAELEE